MKIQAHPTHQVKVGELLEAICDQYLPALSEKNIVAITSKIISLCEGNVVSKHEIKNKDELIQREADAYLSPKNNPHGITLTIKNGLLIPSAGIDESNAEECYILYPRDTQKTATEIWEFLRKKNNIKHLGVLITDSHTTPLRRGVTGIGLGWCGFQALNSYIGKPDCFGRPLHFTYANLLDGLAASAVLVMGEGNEQTPLAVISDVPNLVFQTCPPTPDEIKTLKISLSEDLYAPLLEQAPWKSGGVE